MYGDQGRRVQEKIQKRKGIANMQRYAADYGITDVPTGLGEAEQMGYLRVGSIPDLAGNDYSKMFSPWTIGNTVRGTGPNARRYAVVNVGGQTLAKQYADGGSVYPDDLNQMTMEDIIAMLDQMGYVPDGY